MRLHPYEDKPIILQSLYLGMGTKFYDVMIVNCFCTDHTEAPGESELFPMDCWAQAGSHRSHVRLWHMCYSMCAYNLIYNLKYSLDLYNNIVTNCAHFALCSVLFIVSSELLSLALFELSLFGSCLHCHFFLACVRNVILYVHVNHLYPSV